MYEYEADTIAAIVTAPGAAAIGVIRVSGPAAAAVARAVTGGARDPSRWPSHMLVRVDILGPGAARIDDGLAVLMRAPRSYTGEDVLELHCHGSPAALQEILRAVLAAGARAAEPGEFTKRAFLNGKLDLAQAEAVMDLVRCRTPTAAARAADQLAGALSRHLAELRERLIRLKGHLEVLIDFSDEDVDLEPEAVAAEAEVLRRVFADLAATYESGRIFREGLRVALVGRPNVGKSSLLNALARANRAIVTEIPGTTRDVIEETIDVGGVPVMVVDTAGLRDGAATDRVEEIGIERARAAAAAADLVIAVVDRSVLWADPPYLPGGGEQRLVLAVNKIDLPAAWQEAPPPLRDGADAVVGVSALTGAGLADLEEAIVAVAGRAARDATPPLTNTRQRDAIAKVEASLGDAVAAARSGAPPEIVAVDVQLALQHLGAVTGEIATDDVLDLVFREFCMGK
jgi:tRNA modification GTPase